MRVESQGRGGGLGRRRSSAAVGSVWDGVGEPRLDFMEGLKLQHSCRGMQKQRPGSWSIQDVPGHPESSRSPKCRVGRRELELER